MTDEIEPNGNEVSKVIQELADPVWAKCQRFRVQNFEHGRLIDTITSKAPYTSFRLGEPNQRFIEALGDALAAFPSKWRWVLESRARNNLGGVNYIIKPSNLPDGSVEQAKEVFVDQCALSQFIREKLLVSKRQNIE